MKLYKKYRTLLNREGINTPLRLAHFFAQIDHESRLEPISENLNYSAEGLMKVFKDYFPTLQMAKIYARKPERIANKVYAGRIGNGSESSGDGWKYRGRGFIQLTGKDNYMELSTATGINFVDNPDKLLNEADAMVAAIWYWKSRGLNRFADVDDIRSVTLRINGGYNGLSDRKRLLEKYKLIFEV
jgi:putative chitinase